MLPSWDVPARGVCVAWGDAADVDGHGTGLSVSAAGSWVKPAVRACFFLDTKE